MKNNRDETIPRLQKFVKKAKKALDEGGIWLSLPEMDAKKKKEEEEEKDDEEEAAGTAAQVNELTRTQHLTCSVLITKQSKTQHAAEKRRRTNCPKLKY